MPLSALGVGSSLLALIADSLGYIFDRAGNKKQELLDYLGYRQVLLVLDSFETLMESTGLVAEILASSPTSKVLVTSRLQLNLSGEQVYPLGGMDTPPEDAEGEMLGYSAVELFLEAARRVDNDYLPDQLEGVASICRAVDGMPLSLLLASTWVREYPAQEIATQIRCSLDFLSVEWADLPERQRSLRATYEYSWNMLSETEQHALMKLSVFRAPFPLEAAEQVAKAGPTLLRALVGKSLLGEPSVGRYHMHDLVRQFSAEKLTEMPSGLEDKTHQEHANYFADRLVEWVEFFGAAGRPARLAKMEQEVNDAQAAWDWAAQHGNIKWLSRARGCLLGFYSMQYRYQELDHACRVALEGIKDCPIDGPRYHLESRLLTIQAQSNYYLGQMDVAHQLISLSQERLDQAKIMGEDIRIGQAALWFNYDLVTHSLPEQIDYIKRSADLYQELGFPDDRANALMVAGEEARFLADRKLAFDCHREALELRQGKADFYQLASFLMELAYDYLVFGPWETGLRMMKEAAQNFISSGLIDGPAMAEVHLACAMGYSGYFEESCRMLEAALVTARQLGYHYLIGIGSVSLGIFQAALGQDEQAFTTLQEALNLSDRNVFAFFASSCRLSIGFLEINKGNIIQAADDFQHEIDFIRQFVGRALLGTALAGLALARHLSGQEANALDALKEALHIYNETHCRWFLFSFPAALVVILADIGIWELAVEAYAALATDPIVANSHSIASLIGNRMQLARENLGEEAYQAAEARGHQGDVFEVLGRLAEDIKVWGVLPDEQAETVQPK